MDHRIFSDFQILNLAIILPLVYISVPLDIGYNKNRTLIMQIINSHFYHTYPCKCDLISITKINNIVFYLIQGDIL